MIVVRRSRILFWVPLFCLAFLSLAWLHLRHQQLLPFSTSANKTVAEPATASPPLDPALIPFWDSVIKALLDAKPRCVLPDDPIKAPAKRFASLKKGSNDRPDLLRLTQDNVHNIRDAHSRFMVQIPRLAAQIPFKKDTRGVVTTAAGEFLPTLVVSLRMLRRTGSKLPVQVFVESRDVYEKEICEEVLPALNATCFLLSDVLGAVPQHIEISQPRFQLRSVAMLFSSFDDILLLDADAIVTEPPERWMSEEPFISRVFVSWPDYVTFSITMLPDHS